MDIFYDIAELKTNTLYEEDFPLLISEQSLIKFG